MLRNHDLGAALVEVGDDVVAVEGLVGDQRAELDALDQRRHADGIEALPRQQHESDEIAQSVGEGQDFGRHAPLGTADGLAPSPPFAPCPCRWTLTMVASTMAYSMTGWSEAASKGSFSTAAMTKGRSRLKSVFWWSNSGVGSRHGLGVSVGY